MDEGDLQDVKIDRKQLAEICHRFRINPVVLFGSRAKGWSTPDSDYDIGVWLEDYPFGGDRCRDMGGVYASAGN
ncbi:TPA: nucleotidyltransferase domain-containing protein, partial [Candidatus Poribacteria bacterium]|nr:nucleotidyltransferase domain-containing protein [Candidatus Poribacteria bacterium]HEX29826.1 nucleotidyltransferase domain-containing protein [Candidatus Poribacteria bacterium]